MELKDDHQCFVCGLKNQEGLRLIWKTEGLVTTTHFIPEAKYQGWAGIVHGGILATLLDEAMTRLASEISGGAVTAEMTVRYKTPARVGTMLFIRGEITASSKKLIEMKASIHENNEAGIVIAQATGKAIVKSPF